MKKLSLMGCLVAFMLGCGQAPPPTGPAAEAETTDVDVTIPSENTATPSPEATSQVSFQVPGMS